MFVENAFRELEGKMKNNTEKLARLANNFGLATEQNQKFFKDLAQKQTQLLDLYMETEELRSEEREEDAIDEEYLTKLEWLKAGTSLKASQPDDQRQENPIAMSSGTCEWILTEKDFVSWKRGAYNRIIWICGKAGSGKIFLCSSVITHLAKRTTPNDTEPILTYFFCKIDDPSRSKGEEIMLHLLTQLFGVLSSLDKKFASPIHPGDHLTKGKIIRALAEEANDKKRADEFGISICARIFQRIVRELDRKVFIVLDALDECADRQNNGLFDALTQMVEQEPNVQLLIASRDEDDIRETFMSKVMPITPFYTIEVSAAATRADIASYLAQSLSRYRLKDPEWARRIILERSEGIFQYAAMALRSLESDPVLMRGNPVLAIKRLLKGLNKLYDQRLSEMNSVSRRSLKIMLRWLAYSEYSVKLIPVIDEIVERYRQEGDDILTGPVPEETEEERGTARDFWNDLYPEVRDFIKNHDDTAVIEAQHKSILDWIRSPVQDPSVCRKCGQGKADEAPTWDVAPPRGKFIMAHGVMKTLTHPRFPEKYLNSNDKNLWQRYELWNRCSLVCAAERASGEEDRESGEWKRFYEDTDKFVYEKRNRIYFGNWKTQIQKQYYFPEQPLSIAADIGSLGYFKRHFEIALKQNDVLSQRDSLGLSPLHWACLGNGKIHILRFILDKDQSQVNVQGGPGLQTPLHSLLGKVRFGSTTAEEVKLLITKGARGDIQDLKGDTCLHAAVRSGHLEFCKEILQKEEVEVNAQNKLGETPIFKLAHNAKDHMDIVRLLIGAGANLRIKGTRNRILLSWAVLGRSPKFARLVLEKAPEILDATGSSLKDTALHGAALMLDKSIVQLLLERNADISIRNSSGFTPLQVALVSYAFSTVSREHTSDSDDTLYMLLEKSPSDENGVDALNTAIETDLPQFCKRLAHLAHHLDRHGWFPLMVAKQAKRENIYEMMLKSSDTNFLPRSDQVHSLWSPHSPSSWDKDSAGGLLDVADNGVTISGRLDGKVDSVNENLAVRGNHPITPEKLQFYYEIRIDELLEQKQFEMQAAFPYIDMTNQSVDANHEGLWDSQIEIGFSSQISTHGRSLRREEHSRLPSWIQGIDDDAAFALSHGNQDRILLQEPGFMPGLTCGDIVGAGIDFTAQQIFFTKNGERLDFIFEGRNIKGRLSPVVALYDAGVKITANFGTPGSPPFKYKWEGYHQNE
ncbi:hypothetical protein IWX90DRAFT_186617 [Phyllosticta citrichinensis]|uniref:Protein SSH4 n=1 Tax=Phyllosticta citrichinensis TaxID=1130410 RepID=A0ABR1XW68_9PEZI